MMTPTQKHTAKDMTRKQATAFDGPDTSTPIDTKCMQCERDEVHTCMACYMDHKQASYKKIEKYD